MFKVFKPRKTLKESDTYQTKIELASSIVTELIEFGFKIESVLADRLKNLLLIILFIHNGRTNKGGKPL